MMISSTGNSPLTGEWLLPFIDLSCTEKNFNLLSANGK